MNGLGEQVLARPRLTEDQDGGKAMDFRLTSKELLDLSPDGGESPAVTDQPSQRHGAAFYAASSTTAQISTTSEESPTTTANYAIYELQAVALQLPLSAQ